MQPRVQKRKLPPTVTTKDPRRRAQNQPLSEPPTKIVPLSVPRSSGSLSGLKREVKPEMPGSGEGRSQWENFGASQASSSTDVFSNTSRPKLEWKTEEKPQLSLFTAVLTELRVAAGCQDVSSMLEIIARINSIYLNRLQHREAMEAISVFSEIFSGKTIRGLLSVGAELIQIARTIFIKFDMTRAVAEKFFAAVSNVSIRKCYSLYSLMDPLLISKKLPVDQITHVFEEAKLSLVKEEGKLRLGTAKLLIAYLQRIRKDPPLHLSSRLLQWRYPSNHYRRPLVAVAALESYETMFGLWQLPANVREGVSNAKSELKAYLPKNRPYTSSDLKSLQLDSPDFTLDTLKKIHDTTIERLQEGNQGKRFD